MQRVAVVGATGAVGQELLQLLEERRFPIHAIRCFASSRSQGKTVSFRGNNIPIEPLETLGRGEGIDLAFLAAGSTVSKMLFGRLDCPVIDASSAFRMDPHIPLIIPEINAHAMRGFWIASPNCVATLMLMPLFALHRRFQIQRIIASTYQAVSGGGAKLMQRLLEETALGKTSSHAFNLYLHDSPLNETGYTEEEVKVVNEMRKILEDDTIQVSVTSVRVPVLRAHSIATNVQFQKPFTLDEVYRLLEKIPGLKIFEDRVNNRFPTPFDVTGKDEVYSGRFRRDITQPNALEFWTVGDQLRKGAALNAVQIGEILIAKG